MIKIKTFYKLLISSLMTMLVFGGLSVSNSKTLMVQAADDYHNCSTWSELSSLTGSSLESGSYILSGDINVTMSEHIAINGTVNLCLNGHTIDLGHSDCSFDIPDGSKFNIYDCSAAKSGTISSTYSEVAILKGGQLSLYGGTLTNSHSSYEVIKTNSAYSNGVITINKGAIKATNGGTAVSLNGSKLVMNDGVISAKRANGVFASYEAIINVNGGEISTECDTNSGANGALFLDQSTVCKITNGKVSATGTNSFAIFVQVPSVKLEISGGIVSASGTNSKAIYGNSTVVENPYIFLAANPTITGPIVCAKNSVSAKIGETSYTGQKVNLEIRKLGQTLYATVGDIMVKEIASNGDKFNLVHDTYGLELSGTNLIISATRGDDESGGDDVNPGNTEVTLNPGNLGNGGSGVITVGSKRISSFVAPKSTDTSSKMEFDGYYTAATGGVRIVNKDGSFVSDVSGITNAKGEWIATTSITIYAQYVPAKEASNGWLVVLLIIIFLLIGLYTTGYFFLYRKGKLDDKAIRVIYKILPRGDENLDEEQENKKVEETK